MLEKLSGMEHAYPVIIVMGLFFSDVKLMPQVVCLLNLQVSNVTCNEILKT